MLKYLVIGLGGIGGPLAHHLARAGFPVTAIARGKHLQAIRENGLTIRFQNDKTEETVPLTACDMAQYTGSADVIFVCVKGYSLAETIPFIRRIASPETVVIPLLNVYGTGENMQKELPGILVTDGCVYISAQRSAPGVIDMNSSIFRIVYGARTKEDARPVLQTIAADLETCGIQVVLSENIRRDALQKFGFVSPMGACGLYWECTAGALQKSGAQREYFIALTREIIALAAAMGITFKSDLVETNLKILDALAPASTTSLQRDVRAGSACEADGLIYEVVRMGQRLGVETPAYAHVADKLRALRHEK